MASKSKGKGKDFSKMRYDLSKIPKGGKVLNYFSDLGEWYEDLRETVPGLDHDKCLRYAILITDRHSPILTIPDWEKMQEEALKIAGFKQDKSGNFPERIKLMAEGHNMRVNTIITRLFIIMNDFIYESWYTQKVNYHFMTTSLRRPPNVMDTDALMREQTSRAKIQSQLGEMANNLNKLEAKMFPNPYAKDAVISVTAGKMKNYAEEMATSGGLT